jgi:hypothetical protein
MHKALAKGRVAILAGGLPWDNERVAGANGLLALKAMAPPE